MDKQKSADDAMCINQMRFVLLLIVVHYYNMN